jgi:hypothetical protein
MGPNFKTQSDGTRAVDENIHVTYKQIYKNITIFSMEHTYHEETGSVFFGQ